MSNVVTIGISSIVAVGTVVALGVSFYPGWEGNRGTDSAGAVSGEKAQDLLSEGLSEPGSKKQLCDQRTPELRPSEGSVA